MTQEQNNFSQSLKMFLASVLFLLAGISSVIVFTSSLPEDLYTVLILRLTASGIVLTLVSYGVYQSGLLQYLGSLRLLMLLIVLITVGIILFFLWIVSQLFFAYSHYLPIMTTVLFFAGMSAIAFGYFVSRALTSRIFLLADAAMKVAQGDFSTRLETEGNDELAYLMTRFNAMVADLQQVEEQKQQLEQSRRNLIAWVSHDLRTPLASMRVMLEALADGVISDKETQQRYISSSLGEIQHLSRLINDLFEMSKLDLGHLDFDMQSIPLADLISDTMGSMMAKAQSKQISLEGEVDESLDLVNLAPDKIQRVLKNLLDNAIKFSPIGSTVKISAYPFHADSIKVDVINTGAMIDEKILPKLFDSFYRGEESRAHQENERGTGLGLAIARGFVEAHGGKIWAESHAEKGTIFSFTLPIKP